MSMIHLLIVWSCEGESRILLAAVGAVGAQTVFSLTPLVITYRLLVKHCFLACTTEAQGKEDVFVASKSSLTVSLHGEYG